MTGEVSKREQLVGDETISGEATQPAASPPQGEELARGAEVGRYVILRRIGTGGMGIVYAAYDPELDRRLALKVLLPRSRKKASDGAARLLREAQAMAKLSHPNVIAVHDVGREGDRVFIAMEFVKGHTLGEWVAKSTGGWREVIKMFSQAGRGLAAAHEAGLVHRDFKPDNVLVGEDGRARVLDFGLARAQIDTTTGEHKVVPRSPTDPEVSIDRSFLNTNLTRSGATMGTPAYMAPEQHIGTAIEDAADQFSFCVALYEALYGKRPYEGKTLSALTFNVLQGKWIAPPRDAAAPRWLWEVIQRGLSTKANDRWPSVNVLLAELARDPQAVRRRWLLATVGLVGVVGIGLGTWQTGRSSNTLCRGSEQELAGVWDDDRRAQMHAAFEAADVVYAATTREAAETRLEQYADAWVAMHTEACQATHVHGTQSAAMLDLRMECLDRRRADLDAVAKVLVDADAGVVERAVQTVASLPPIDACADTHRLRAEVRGPEDPALAAEVDGIRRDLSTARAREGAGKIADALALAQGAEKRAKDSGYGPVHAEALHVLAKATVANGDYKGAEKPMLDAYWIAAAEKHEVEAANTAIELSYLIGYRNARKDEGMAWAEHARVAIKRANLGTVAQARLSESIGGNHFRAGEFDLAAERFQEALELLEESEEVDELDLANVVNSVGAASVKAARFEEAGRSFQRALDIRVRLQGPKHPAVARQLNNLGIVARNLGQPDQAIDYYERALDIREKTQGKEHPEVAQALVNLSIALQRKEELELAEEHLRRAVAIFEKFHGPDHPDTGTALSTLGSNLSEQEEYEDALEVYDRALGIALKQAPEHPETGLTVGAKANVLSLMKRYDEALVEAERGLQIVEGALGPDHPLTAETLHGYGVILSEAKRHDEARAKLERALELRIKSETPAYSVAGNQFALARTLWAFPDQRDRALALAREAEATLKKNDPETMLEPLGDWLDDHGG